MNILIAPIGNVEKYEEVTYILETKEKKSKISFSLLEEIKKPEKVIIIALDTLANEGEKYEEIEEEVKNKICSFVKEGDQLKSKDIEIIVAPGVGRFSGDKKIFKGKMRDYYSFLFYHLAEEFVKGDEPLYIYLDLSHGINYMPVLTYQAIKEAGALVAIKREVTLETYNSDPVTGKPSESDRFQINKVNEEKVEFTIKKYLKTGSKSRPLEPLSQDVDRKRLDAEITNTLPKKEEILAFLGAVFHGLPLAIFTFYPEIDTLKDKIRQIYEKWREHINLIHENESLICERKLAFTDFFEVLVRTVVIGESFNIERRCKVMLKELKDLYERFFKDKFVGYFIEKEFDQTFEKIKDKIGKDWKFLIEIMREEHSEQIKIGAPDRRNFFAHAGFEGNAVLLRREENNIYLKYDASSIETIRRYCMEGICLKKTS
jgi:CRISPR-associated protein Csx1